MTQTGRATIWCGMPWGPQLVLIILAFFSSKFWEIVMEQCERTFYASYKWNCGKNSTQKKFPLVFFFHYIFFLRKCIDFFMKNLLSFMQPKWLQISWFFLTCQHKCLNLPIFWRTNMKITFYETCSPSKWTSKLTLKIFIFFGFLLWNRI